MKLAKHLIGSVTDEGSFVTHTTQPRFVWGTAKIRGTHVIIACNEMDEALGAMGYQELSELAKAFSLAASNEAPLIWLARGSGIDVTDNVSAAFESGHISHIRRELATRHVPYIAIASSLLVGESYILASQADLFFSTTDATLIHLGPRVIELSDVMPLPVGFQTATWVLNHGHLDGVYQEDQVPQLLGDLVGLLDTEPESEIEIKKAETVIQKNVPDYDSWLSDVYRQNGPCPRELIDDISDIFIELRGDRTRYNDTSIFGGVASIGGVTMVVIGTDAPRNADTAIRRSLAHTRPAAIRKAIRLISLASRLRIPILSVIDCPDVAAEIRSEEEGVAGLIGQLTSVMISAEIPTIGIISGPAEGMVAVSLSMVDFLLMKEHSYLSALGLKALGFGMFHDPGRIVDAAAKGHVSPSDLLSSGHADMVLPSAPKTCGFADNVKAAVIATIDTLLSSENPPTRRWRSVEA